MKTILFILAFSYFVAHAAAPKTQTGIAAKRTFAAMMAAAQAGDTKYKYILDNGSGQREVQGPKVKCTVAISDVTAANFFMNRIHPDKFTCVYSK